MGVWITILIAAAAILTGIGIYAWRHRTIPGAASFGLLMFAVADWSLAYALELNSVELSAKMLWIRVEYVGIALAPLFWLVFALQYTGQGRWLSRRNLTLVSLVPAITIILVGTTGWHHLHYVYYGVTSSTGWPMLEIEYGPWFWVLTTYAYLCLLAGTFLLGRAFAASSAIYRRQAAVLLAGALIPWISNALYLAGLVLHPYLDTTPLTFALSGAVIAYGLFRYRLLQVVPVAQRAVIDSMPTAMIVLDTQDRIADLNPAARLLFDLGERAVVGRPYRQVLGPAEVIAPFANVAQTDTRVEMGTGDNRRVFQMSISPLGNGAARDKTHEIGARLVLISDATAEVQAREVLAQRNRHLTLLHEIARVASSTLDLATLYQRLADTLAQIIGGDGCYITRLDPITGHVVGCAAYGPFRDAYRQVEAPAGEVTLTVSVLKSGRPIAVEDVFDSPYISPRIAAMFPARSQLGLPLRVAGQDLGAVLIAFNEHHIFAAEEITWATQAVDLAALALQNALLFQRAEQSTRDWEATFDAMPDLIAVLDGNHRIVRANKALGAKLGVSPPEVIGLNYYSLVHGTDQPPDVYPSWQALAEGRQYAVEIEKERLGGHFLVGISPVCDATGSLAGTIHVARDITERKLIEEEREQLIQELTQALAKVKTLSGLLPICARCKNIRDDQGYWHSVEVYVRDHTEADFSHSICPSCMAEMYPWYGSDEVPGEKSP